MARLLDRNRYILAAVLVMGVAAAVAWWSLHERARFAMWSAVSAQPLSAKEAEALASCESVGWWGWARVLAQDRPLPCGEHWAAVTMAPKLRPADRRAWVHEQLAVPSWTPLAALRATRALEVGGWPVTPSSDQLLVSGALAPADRERILVEEGVEWSPRLRWLALSYRVAAGGDIAEADLEALRALHALAPDEGVEGALSSWVGMDIATVRTLAAGGPPHEVPLAWAEPLAQLGACSGRCVDEWIGLVSVQLAAPDGEDLPRDDASSWEGADAGGGSFEPLLDFEQQNDHARRALAHLLASDAAWWASRPSYGLGRFQAGPAPEGVLQGVWSGRLGPWGQALWYMEVGARSGRDAGVRQGDSGLWVEVDGQRWVLCGKPGPGRAPDAAEVAARALMEIHGEPARAAAARLGGWSGVPHVLFGDGGGPAPMDPCAASPRRPTEG